MLGGNVFPQYHLPLTILVDSFIHVCSGILLHPIMIDNEERVVSEREDNSRELALDR